MKVAIVFLAMLVCALADEKYTTKYDNIDLDSILNSDRLLNNYINCLLDVGSCTPDAKELKKALPDALENECEKCSEKQKTGSEKVIRFLVNKAEGSKYVEARSGWTGPGSLTAKLDDHSRYSGSLGGNDEPEDFNNALHGRLGESNFS